MSVFLMAQIEIHDREEYGKYEAGFAGPFAEYGGTVLSVSERPSVIEGRWPYTRTVLIEFPDREAADGWYNSPGYQAIIGHRQAASTANVIVVDGYKPSTA